jgi:hypothetical protein
MTFLGRTAALIFEMLAVAVFLAACGTNAANTRYHDPQMDFSALRNVAVMPLANLSRDQMAGQRVRDTFMNSLMATGVVYVIPPGEVSRGIARAGISDPTAPSMEEIGRVSVILQADAVITGAVREYGEVRSGNTSANVISVGMEMFEAKTRRVVWTASTTKGGISMADRLLGSGGQPMNEVTQAAVNDLINKLLY